MAINSLNIVVTGGGTHTLQVIDVSGRLIKEITKSGDHKYGLSMLEKPGIYIIRLVTQSAVITRQLVKM